MKLFCVLSLSLSLVLCGAPLTVLAGIETEVFILPEGRVAEEYQVDIEAILRDKYRLKIETGVRNSILQWALLDGELPLGLAIRTDGNLIGVPKSSRTQSYQFTVKVVDVSLNSSGPLVIPLSLAVGAPRLRLTRLSVPELVPLGTTAEQPSNGTLASGEQVASPDVAEVTGSVTPLQRSGAPSGQTPQSANMVTPAPISEMRGGAGTATGCAAGGHRVVSDEAHNPLEGDTSTQNTCVQFDNLNTLKYRYEFNEKRTTTAGPDISTLPFLPKLTPTATSTAVTPSTSSTPSPTGSAVMARKVIDPSLTTPSAVAVLTSELQRLNVRFNEARGILINEVEPGLRDTIEIPVNDRVTSVQDAHKASIRLANNADLYLQSNNVSGLLAEVVTVKAKVDGAVNLGWPVTEIANILSKLDGLTIRLEDLRFDDSGKHDISQEAWVEWLVSNQDRYNRFRDRITELKNKVSTINSGASAFDDSKNVLKEWQSIINNINNQQAAAFRQNVFVSCHNDEGENQSSKLTISKTDRTVANQAATTREVLTVNCYSRVAFTAGFNFSTLDEKEFSVVQAAGSTPGTVVKEFGFTSRSSFRPNPLLLLNIRFTDNPVYNWHASFGAVVDLKGQPGTDIEPVGGLSFSIRRLMYITPFAVHFGRVNRLAGGFNVGDQVPDTVATPPIEKTWKIGYTAGVTFRIAP